MQRVLTGLVAVALGLCLAFAISACGGDDETTTTATQTQTATQPTQTATTQTTQTATTTTTQTPADCGPNQVFSQGSGTCVDIRQGANPCPPGEVPMADRPICVPKE